MGEFEWTFYFVVYGVFRNSESGGGRYGAIGGLSAAVVVGHDQQSANVLSDAPRREDVGAEELEQSNDEDDLCRGAERGGAVHSEVQPLSPYSFGQIRGGEAVR